MGTTTAPEYPPGGAVETLGTVVRRSRWPMLPEASVVSDETKNLDIDAHLEGRRVVLVVRGDVDMATAPRLIAAMHDHAAPPVRHIDLDCEGVGFLDSAGVRALIMSRNEAGRFGIDVGIVQPSRSVRRVLEMTGLSALLTRPGSNAS
jgi:anti-anti-sigma factor